MKDCDHMFSSAVSIEDFAEMPAKEFLYRQIKYWDREVQCPNLSIMDPNLLDITHASLLFVIFFLRGRTRDVMAIFILLRLPRFVLTRSIGFFLFLF